MADEAEAQRSSVFAAIVSDLTVRSALDREQLDRLEVLLADPDLHMQQRDVPAAGVSLAGDSATFVRAGAIAETVGPITGADGRPIWFDFFPIARLVPVFFAGDAEPALLFTLRERRLRRIDAIPVLEAVRLLQRRYELGRGSIWIRANLLAAGAPAGTYVGLHIASGELIFVPPPVDAAGRLTIPVGGRCAIELVLDAPPAPPGPGGRAGKDAADAELVTPPTVTFVLGGDHARETEVADAHWRLFGQDVDFRWDKGVPIYEAELHSVVVPMEVSVERVEPVVVESPLVGLSGTARVALAGWMLPATTIDVNNPTEASGAGGLTVRTADGLAITWNGLRNGPVRLPSPWLLLLAGAAGLIELHADDLYGRQRFELWSDGHTPFRSEIDVRYSTSFPVSFASSSTGVDLLVTSGAVDARLDRPVDVRGTPLAIHTLASRLVLSMTDTASTLHIADADVLADALALQGTYPVEPGGSISLAIRNALFTATPVNSIALAGDLAGSERVVRGRVTLGLGLLGALPTLPDPYAANVGWLLAGRTSRAGGAEVIELLQASVRWQVLDIEGGVDEVITSFAFASVGSQADAFAKWIASRRRRLTGRVPISLSALADAAVAPPPVAPEASVLSFIAHRDNTEGLWNQYFGVFEFEQFALLDVSSHADQMGVSFAGFDPRQFGERSPVLRRIFGNAPVDTTTFPLEVRDLDLSAQSRFVRAFTVPQVSWEPMVNLTPPDTSGDPPFGFDLFPDDGGPTRLFNDALDVVPIAPIPVVEFLVRDFTDRADGFTGGLFTLPFGMRAFAEFSRLNQFTNKHEGAAQVSYNRKLFSDGALTGGIQVRVDAPTNPPESPIFQGSTLQFPNLLRPDGTPTGTGALGASVGEVFNAEFFLDAPTGDKHRGVPVTRIDFSGYGASLFSHWLNPNAVVAATSQVFFDVFVGRTGHEVVQIRSLLYPWGVHVVRTITMFRGSNGYVFRTDSGWQAESPGVYDFSYRDYGVGFPRPVISEPSPYEVHPGVVRGIFNVRNIHETQSVPAFEDTWVKQIGEFFIDPDGVKQPVDASTPILNVHLQPVYFDADVEIDGVTSGAIGGRVPSKGMLGYVQLAPRGEPIAPRFFVKLLESQLGSLGGPVDCVIDVAGSGQAMRISRVDLSPSSNGSGPIFVAAARGAVTLPKNGSWSVVQHNQGTGEVSPLEAQATVPVIRRGRLDVASGVTDANANDLVRLANPADLVTPPTAASRNYALLQSTGTQKALFRRPSFKSGVDTLLGDAPDFADAYRIVNSSGIFPNVADALPMALGAFQTKVIPQGFKLLDAANPGAALEQVLPRGPLFLINESFLKIYVEYAPTDKAGNSLGNGSLKFGFDSSAPAGPDQWLSKVNDIGMVVDLGSMKRLVTIRGKFDAENGSQPGFREPELIFSDALQPVIDILQVLEALSTGDYASAMKKGLDVAMSNSADSWNYAFHARQEIGTIKFPPEPEFSTSAVDPLKLEAHLAIGVYFNEALQVTSDPKQLVPSAGAFFEFGGSLSVMCVSLAAATIYATGSVDLRTAADIKTGPSLHMKFGFGCEIVVGLPVVGGVTLTYMVGIEIDLDTGSITVSGFLLFRGRAELLGGLITVQIQIEAKGSVKHTDVPSRTDLIAQVTFGLDISIFFVINISFSESWQESRQIG